MFHGTRRPDMTFAVDWLGVKKKQLSIFTGQVQILLIAHHVLLFTGQVHQPEGQGPQVPGAPQLQRGETLQAATAVLRQGARVPAWSVRVGDMHSQVLQVLQARAAPRPLVQHQDRPHDGRIEQMQACPLLLRRQNHKIYQKMPIDTASLAFAFTGYENF